MNNIIKDTRIKHGLNQSDMADKLGYSQGTISKWENGTSPIRESVVNYVRTLDGTGHFNNQKGQ